MSPEQFDERIHRQFYFSSRELTTRSDIYSFGVTFYEVLTGRLPFVSVEQIFTQSPVNPMAINRSIPEQVDLLLMKCLNKEPEKRHASFEELVTKLVEIYNALPTNQKAFGSRYVIKGRKEPLIIHEWVNKGSSLSNLGKSQEAITCYERAIEIDPREADAWNNKGSVLGTLGKYHEALHCFNIAIDIDRYYAQAWRNKSVALKRLGRIKEAEHCLDVAQHCYLDGPPSNRRIIS